MLQCRGAHADLSSIIKHFHLLLELDALRERGLALGLELAQELAPRLLLLPQLCFSGCNGIARRRQLVLQHMSETKPCETALCFGATMLQLPNGRFEMICRGFWFSLPKQPTCCN